MFSHEFQGTLAFGDILANQSHGVAKVHHVNGSSETVVLTLRTLTIEWLIGEGEVPLGHFN